MTAITSEKINILKAHLALNVKNVEISIEFYKKMLGIKPCKIRNGYAKFDMQNPPLNLTLNQNDFEAQGALSHLGIQVESTSDVLAMREQCMNADYSRVMKWTPIAVMQFSTKPGFTIQTVTSGKFLS